MIEAGDRVKALSNGQEGTVVRVAPRGRPECLVRWDGSPRPSLEWFGDIEPIEKEAST